MAGNLKPTTDDKIKQELGPPDPRRIRRLARKNRLSFNFLQYGYVTADGDPIPPEYLVKITSFRNNASVVAPLQDKINMTVESYWEPIIPTSILRSANIFVQAGTVAKGGGVRSAITSATTRRLWQGTSPMVITVPLKFEAVRDPYIEVVEPCRLLQTMAAPSDPSSSRDPVNIGGVASGNVSISDVVSDLPMLIPPGPSPFIWKNLLGGQVNYTKLDQQTVQDSSRGGDFIIIEFGTFLTFWNVIIKSPTVSFDVKFDDSGYPISAEAEVTFETYEMPTKESLEYSYTRIVPPTPKTNNPTPSIPR